MSKSTQYKIFKYELEDSQKAQISMPIGSKVLNAAIQNYKIVLWALVDPNLKTEIRHFCVVGTGQSIKYHADELFHITTFQDRDLVYHIFEII